MTLVHVDAILGLILNLPILGIIVAPVNAITGTLFAISFSIIDTFCR